MKPTIDEQIAMCEAEAKTYWRTTAIKSAKTHEAAAGNLRNYKELVDYLDKYSTTQDFEEQYEVWSEIQILLTKIKQS